MNQTVRTIHVHQGGGNVTTICVLMRIQYVTVIVTVMEIVQMAVTKHTVWSTSVLTPNGNAVMEGYVYINPMFVMEGLIVLIAQMKIHLSVMIGHVFLVTGNVTIMPNVSKNFFVHRIIINSSSIIGSSAKMLN